MNEHWAIAWIISVDAASLVYNSFCVFLWIFACNVCHIVYISWSLEIRRGVIFIIIIFIIMVVRMSVWEWSEVVVPEELILLIWLGDNLDLSPTCRRPARSPPRLTHRHHPLPSFHFNAPITSKSDSDLWTSSCIRICKNNHLRATPRPKTCYVFT